jgi:Ulp1 family protease
MSSSVVSADRLLVNYNDAVIYASDLAILDSSTAWLNDACINFQLTRLQQQQQQQRERCDVSIVNNKQDGSTVEEQYLFLDP